MIDWRLGFDAECQALGLPFVGGDKSDGPKLEVHPQNIGVVTNEVGPRRASFLVVEDAAAVVDGTSLQGLVEDDAGGGAAAAVAAVAVAAAGRNCA